MPARMLLAIIELGGYPDFRALYERAGYTVETVNSVRKAITLLKTLQPDVIVAEFNYQSDFRDRTSSLESLLATMQRLPNTRLIIFYEREFAHQLTRVTSRFPVHATLTFPIDETQLDAALRSAAT
jgi:AmiR/NasT family two-component response regulator